jgi:hypothetical protein
MVKVLVLRTCENERQVAACTTEGFTPSQCTRFVFQALPTTFLDLKQLVVLDHNLACANGTKSGRSGDGTERSRGEESRMRR